MSTNLIDTWEKKTVTSLASSLNTILERLAMLFVFWQSIFSWNSTIEFDPDWYIRHDCNHLERSTIDIMSQMKNYQRYLDNRTLILRPRSSQKCCNEVPIARWQKNSNSSCSDVDVLDRTCISTAKPSSVSWSSELCQHDSSLNVHAFWTVLSATRIWKTDRLTCFTQFHKSRHVPWRRSISTSRKRSSIKSTAWEHSSRIKESNQPRNRICSCEVWYGTTTRAVHPSSSGELHKIKIDI